MVVQLNVFVLEREKLKNEPCYCSVNLGLVWNMRKRRFTNNNLFLSAI